MRGSVLFTRRLLGRTVHFWVGSLPELPGMLPGASAPRTSTNHKSHFEPGPRGIKYTRKSIIPTRDGRVERKHQQIMFTSDFARSSQVLKLRGTRLEVQVSEQHIRKKLEAPAYVKECAGLVCSSRIENLSLFNT